MTGLIAPLPSDFFEYISKADESNPIEDNLRLYCLRKGAGHSVSKMQNEALKNILLDVRNLIRKYVDTTEQNIDILSLWVIGTYFHNQFETFPLLQMYAQKRSGKTRTLKLLSSLCKGSDGSVSTSPTETLLFRHKDGALFFDEMESISSKERGAFRETLNAVYKKGNKIIRYKESKSKDGSKEYVEDCFYPYYPIALANISGLGDVLGDRAIQLILQRSNKNVTRLIEDFSTNKNVLALKSKLDLLNATIPTGLFSKWNDFIQGIDFEDKDNLKLLFKRVSDTAIYGRPLEIFFPLFVIAYLCGDLDNFLKTAKNFVELREEEEAISDIDEILKQFIYGKKCEGFISVTSLLQEFRGSLENPEEWQNSKWFGRALKRLGLVQKQRSVNGKSQVLLNNNPTNTTNTINTINTTNTTNEQNNVGLVDFVGLVGQKEQEKGNQDNKKCFICNSPDAFILGKDDSKVYCTDCIDKVDL